MDPALQPLSDQLDFATQRLLGTARIIDEGDLAAPSLLPGWTRGYVLAHLARGADALRNVLVGVRTGTPRLTYASPDAWASDVEHSAAQPRAVLVEDVADAATAFRTVSRQLPDEAWQVQVLLLDPVPFPAAWLLTRRLAEVELHHCDLGTGYGAADWPAAFAAMELPEPVRSQRLGRLGYPHLAPGAGPERTARRPSPWKSGQRLPGSWL